MACRPTIVGIDGDQDVEIVVVRDGDPNLIVLVRRGATIKHC
jgi:hypothetical protein